MKNRACYPYLNCRFVIRGMLVVLAVFPASRAFAATRTWIGGDGNWNTIIFNWSPNDEPDSDDEAVFNTSNSVNLANADEAVMALTLSGGVDLYLNGNNLTVDGGLTSLQNSGTSLAIPTGSTLDADDITLSDDSLLSLSGGEIIMAQASGDAVLTIGSTTMLKGYGTIGNQDAITVSGTTVLSNSGEIWATTFDTLGTAAGTLTITVSDPAGRVDLDQGSASVFIGRNDTLDINGEAHGSSDPFSRVMTFYDGATLDMSNPWEMDTGTLEVNTNGVVAGTAGDPATIAGVHFTQNGGTINLADQYDALRISAQFGAYGGTIANSGLVIFDAEATVFNACDFQMNGSYASIMVNPNVDVYINDQDFNVDGNGLTTNVITVEEDGLLDLNLSSSADTGLSGKINLNGGSMNVEVLLENEWSMDGVGSLTTGTGTGTSIIAGDRVLVDNPVTVNAGSALLFTCPVTWEVNGSASVASTSLLSLDGTNQTVFNGGNFTGDGTLRISKSSLVQANTSISTHTLNWGTSGFTHTIEEGAVLTIDSPSINGDDIVDAMININGNDGGLTINGPTAWTMAAAMTTNTVGAGTATIGGTSRLELADTLSVLGDTDISAPVVFGSGSTATISAGAILDVTGASTFDGGTITGDGSFYPATTNTVQNDSNITVDVLDFDRGNWIVDNDANLVVDVDDYDNTTTQAFDSIITLNSGSMGIMTGEPHFVMDGTLNMNNTTGSEAAWGGQAIEIGNDTGTLDANLDVGGNGISRFFNSVDFNSDADVYIAAGAKLVFNTITDFETDGLDDGSSDAEFTGYGSLIFNSTVNINEALVVDMPGGVFDLDGESTDPGGNYVYVNAPAVLNLSQFSFGQPKAVADRLEVNHLDAGKLGLLTINLPGDTAWTLNSGTGLYLVNDNVAATLLAGEDITINGGIHVTGDVRTDARLDINGSLYIGTAGQPFRLSAGNLLDQLNTLNGGLIDGPGLLGADDLAGLKGYGVINTDLDFDNLSELTANGGLLDVNGEILDIGTLRTDGASAILDLALPFDSALTDNGITLFNGGRIQGAEITVSDTMAPFEQNLRGNGTVQNRIINNHQIRAGGGTLTLENANNDLDGNEDPRVGLLYADSGDLVLNNSSLFPFDGTVRINSGYEVFANGFELRFQSASTLRFYGGTFRSTESTGFFGTIEVNVGGGSIEIPGTATLWMGEVTLNGALELACDNTIINGSVDFFGTGTLRNPSGSQLTLYNGVNIPGSLENNGLLVFDNTLQPAQAKAGAFNQGAGGTLRMQIEGTDIFDYNRILLSGSCQLAGTLEVSLAGGFTPSLGDSFFIISAPGGVSDKFDVEDFSGAGLGSGLVWEVHYLSTGVKLIIVNASAYDDWIDSFPELTDPADKMKTADPDGDGIDNWGEFALDGHPASGASEGKIVGKMGLSGGAEVWTLTFPARVPLTYDPADPPGGELVLRQIDDGIIYTIRASHDLVDFTPDVGEVIGSDAAAIQAGLPALHSGWEYRTYSRPAPVAGNPGEYLYVEVSEM
ncbi:MAG: beta strand repeat-containing protein [Oceanipulchritudo sp.]